MKKLFILAIITAITIGGFVLSRRMNTSTKGDTVTTTGQNSEVSNITVAQMTTEHVETEYSVVDVSYPAPRSSVNEYSEIFEFVNEARSEFESNFTDTVITDSIKRRGEKYNFTLTTAVATSSQTVTYLLELYTETGGAHGGTIVRTFTYDADKKLVELDDVFDGEYLQKIAPLARTYLAARLGEDTVEEMLADGTRPTEDNYSAWYLTDDTITFIFQQYQIGPYVIGINEFPLKKTEVSDLLSPTFK